MLIKHCSVAQALSLIDDLMAEMNESKEKQEETEKNVGKLLASFGPVSGTMWST